MKTYITTLFILLISSGASGRCDSSILDKNFQIEKWLKEKKVPVLGLGIIENGKLQQMKVFGLQGQTFWVGF